MTLRWFHSLQSIFVKINQLLLKRRRHRAKAVSSNQRMVVDTEETTKVTAFKDLKHHIDIMALPQFSQRWFFSASLLCPIVQHYRNDIFSILQWTYLLNYNDENVFTLESVEPGKEKEDRIHILGLRKVQLASAASNPWVKVHLLISVCLALTDVVLYGIFFIVRKRGKSLFSSSQSTPSVRNTHFSSIFFDLYFDLWPW